MQETLEPTAFLDATGRKWTIGIDFYTVERTYAATNVSLLKLLDDKCKPLAELLDNLPVLGHVCYVLADAEAHNVTPRDFAKAIKGDAIEQMADAFLKALELFFPARQRAVLTKALEAARRVRAKSEAKLLTILATIDPEKIAEDAITTLSGEKPSDSLASPESNPPSSDG